MVPAQVGILHPTGYPLYSLLGTLFSLIPIESVAYRANLLSAVAAAGAVGIMVLIAVRLGVRPLIAFAAALALAFTGTIWEEATFSEMNGLHLFIVALLLHRALVWREERRDRDLLLGALLGGLCVSNHGLAITVVPIVVLFVLADARRELRARPVLLVKAGAAFALGLVPYLYLPLRAFAGPADVYSPFLTLEGLFAHISGAQFRGDMHFTSIESVQAAWAALPQVSDQVLALSNPVFVVLGIFGIALLVLSDRWFGWLLVLLGVVNVYFYANYLGDLAHYLLTSWLILAIGLAYAGETLVEVVVQRGGPRLAWVAYAMLILPVVLLASNWTIHDQSANHDGERFTAEVFAALPQDAVLVTYWDALTPLSYKHCIEGVRPDIRLRAYDEKALVTCDPVERPLTDVARRRPIYALLVNDGTIQQVTGLVPVPAQDFVVPWGQRYPTLDRSLYRLVPADQAP
jgi:4-amino-4-deoxy-L-arabinose transferase-like glycosyltransferase